MTQSLTSYAANKGLMLYPIAPFYIELYNAPPHSGPSPSPSPFPSFFLDVPLLSDPFLLWLRSYESRFYLLLFSSPVINSSQGCCHVVSNELRSVPCVTGSVYHFNLTANSSSSSNGLPAGVSPQYVVADVFFTCSGSDQQVMPACV